MKNIVFKNEKRLPFQKSSYVGVAGFEPAASCSQSRRDNRATLHPDKALIASANVQKNFIYSMFLLKKLKKIFSIKVINYIIDI